MKRILAATLTGIALTFTGCAEFDGFYDDPQPAARRIDRDDRGREPERHSDDRTGAYGGADVRR